MDLYSKLVLKVMKNSNMTVGELYKKIKLAQKWHNPLNYDNGNTIAEENGWEYLFTEALEKEGLGRRYYFRFHDYDLTDVNTTYRAFKNCKNFKKYSKVWSKHAPAGLQRPEIYLLALVEMTVRGFKHEKTVMDALRAAGHEITPSSPEEDLKGIDFWKDGKPVQLKSPNTFKNMKLDNLEIEILGAAI